MKFLANENFPAKSVLLLRKNNLDVISIGENYPGISDEEVMNFSIQEQRTILTFDKDYGELIYKYGYKPVAGVLFFRISEFEPEQPGQLLLELLSSNQIEMENYFTVVDSDRIRQRKI
ncbi:MAG: DUF5615 family PIN-like protein [Bacteroidota bacterium]